MSRQTNNSLGSAFFDIETTAEGVDMESTATTSGFSRSRTPAASVVPNEIPATIDPNVTQLSPEVIAAVQLAVKTALAESRATPTENPAVGSLPSAGPAAMADATGLDARADNLLSSGGFIQQGRLSTTVVPTFVNTFTMPAPSLITSASLSSTSQAVPPTTNHTLLNSTNSTNIPGPSGAPSLHQQFVVGPGFSPVPAKMVNQIVTGKYVELSELLAVNLAAHSEPESQLLLDGRVVLTSTAKKPKRRIEDIVSWTEAFTIYCLILTSYFPHRWRDLSQYKLLILRTHRQFSGRVWLSYDQAFREHAAAITLVDWSTIDVQLFNFHTAGASVRSVQGSTRTNSSEPPGSSSRTTCISWNRGHCSSPYVSCRYAHRCSSCSGTHREHECTRSSNNRSQVEQARMPRSPSPAAFSNSKRRKH